MDVIATLSFTETEVGPALTASSDRTMDASSQYAETVGGKVTAVALGGKTQTPALSSSGADRNVMFSDPDFEGSDVGALARMVYSFIGDGEAVVFCHDDVLSGYLAGMLGVPHLRGLHRLDARSGTFLNDGYVFTAEIEGPCVVSVGDGYVGPARKGRDSVAVVMGRVDLGLGFYSVGEKGSMTSSEPFEAPAREFDAALFLGAGQ